MWIHGETSKLDRHSKKENDLLEKLSSYKNYNFTVNTL
ncbi:hypothetical protein LEP1GSC008_2889 [Leptospira kirschneri serovar Bulgarica str. Nikolaevo]|uniref:Uncharacterized protein n=1 Tax=Leptospira kirschneri serovar Bulgarica str. Nikolaevo TaxID=1240687 RepID=M6FN03_9LEPT|nr:hypothetical protein LEP1GSC008_2889 [Leptospira kirschneri serovar Bulgarica str. Nikolaevo]